jgi:hypothetical protein
MPILGIIASSRLTAPATAYESIATVTVGSGGAANVEFTSIPATYTHLQIRLIGRSDRAANLDSLRLQANSDTASNYAEHGLYGDGASAGAFAGTSQTYMQFYRIAGANAGANIFGAIYIDILDYANTNKFKTARSIGGADNNGSGEIYLMSGLWRSTSAITSLKLLPGVGTNFTQYSQFALYGIKGS